MVFIFLHNTELFLAARKTSLSMADPLGPDCGVLWAPLVHIPLSDMINVLLLLIEYSGAAWQATALSADPLRYLRLMLAWLVSVHPGVESPHCSRHGRVCSF